ncbi:hypothetical protein [Cohnella sp. REN36]|uniref:hypothetical protein n=1 Tax=Cohnella sp. REN36 TaxID=2887347 RepID=UPI001D154CA1|nr:hypothetical protein [Cohnella sp. REN36]MCC3376753.1 hypothetical protein [Cohnella sp. REN36]
MAMNREEEALRRWLDDLDEEDAFGRLADVVPSDGESLPADPEAEAAALARVRAAAFAKLGLSLPETSEDDARQAPREQRERATERRPATRRWRKLAAFAAVLAALFLALSIAAGSPDVRAQLRKAFQFLPGFGAVGNTAEQGIQYVLREPIRLDFKGGELEIRGFRVDDGTAVAELSGALSTMIDRFELHNGDGDVYAFTGHRSWSDREWTGTFGYKGPIKRTDRMALSFEGMDHTVPLPLEEAPGSDRMENLGVTDVRNGLALTAVAQDMSDGRTKIALLPQLPKGATVESYGMQPWDIRHPRMTNGTETLELSQDASFPHPNEFYFRKKDLAPSGYVLTIPELILSRAAFPRESFSIPVPGVGETIAVHRTIDVQGFPMTILQVRRLPADAKANRNHDVLEVDVDVRYDAQAAESLLLIFPANGDLKFDEATGAMQHLYLAAPEKGRTMRVEIERIQTVFRGPWVLKLR